ncbi:hypothetical protein K6U27_18385 [Vibrio fluvialis]|uniref:hypothetical protein n=1 Tax=Vibrio fluvialis TaxID=676 RepID=UPI001EEB7EAE|nr:hypothetical protein [Vibrio fluvialis]EKO3382125.1 hypothetical protein [Vibrio fluvialis]MCG6374638.1 hypothetical protein [Vibrio fluvialis]
MLNIALNDLKGIIYTINQYYGYPDYDFSSLFYLGIDRNDIVVLHRVINTLHQMPYLDINDFAGTPAKSVIDKLGGIQRLKEVLAIDDYSFSQFLTDNPIDEKTGMSLPYALYLKFAKEIRRSYMSDNVMLASSLCVQFSDGLRVQAIPLPNHRQTRIPVNNNEAAQVAVMLYSDKYQFKSYDSSASILSLLCISQGRTVDIEVRCCASQLIHHQYPALCVNDDLPEHSAIRDQRKIVSFSRRILPLLQR